MNVMANALHVLLIYLMVQETLMNSLKQIAKLAHLQRMLSSLGR